MLKRTSILILTIFFLILAETSSALALNDVPKGHWAKDSVDQIVNQYGLMQGDPNGNFGGTRALTRYEFAKTISRMIEYVNQELDSDRKDLENIVAIMELFQNELKVLEVKMNNIQDEVKAQNQTIREVNELAILIGDEFSSFVESMGGDSGSAGEVWDARLTNLEFHVNKLDNKGLFIDTLVKGTVNDVKKLGNATARAFSGARTNVNRRNQMNDTLEKAHDEFVRVQEETVGRQPTIDHSRTELERYYDLEVLREVVE
jgi:archaellum component FlaC